MPRLVIALLFLPTLLASQNEWPLQVWKEQAGTQFRQRFGETVGFVARVTDSTQYSVGDAWGVSIFQVRFPSDTLPRYLREGIGTVMGDFNGDGVKDLCVHGDPTRIYLANVAGEFETVPFFTRWTTPEESAPNQSFSVGDVNADGFEDLIISDFTYPRTPFGNPNDYFGIVYVLLGGTLMDTLADASFMGEEPKRLLGYNVASGDVNGDGFDDIVVKGYDHTQAPDVRWQFIKIFLGGETIDSTAWEYLEGAGIEYRGLACFDVNGDGIDDVLWANTDSAVLIRAIRVNFGGSSMNEQPDVYLSVPDIQPGFCIADAGDMNGDGYNDVVAGDPRFMQELGFVVIYSGGPNMDSHFDAALGLPQPSELGWSASSVGDINNDGYDDVIVGAPQWPWFDERGKVLILLGSPNIPVTAVEDRPGSAPREFSLLQNFPNPFNPTTTIQYHLPERSRVNLEVYDLLGRVVSILRWEENQVAGTHSCTFDGSLLPSGSYIYKLTMAAENGAATAASRIMMLIK